MTIRLRCNRTSSADAGNGQVLTERSFVSTDSDGAQLNDNVASASYSESVVGPAADETVHVNDLIDVTTAAAAPASN